MIINEKTMTNEELVKKHAGLCVTTAKKFVGHGVELEDLIQEAYIGLLKAKETWDPERGPFGSHAYFQISSQLQRTCYSYAVNAPHYMANVKKYRSRLIALLDAYSHLVDPEAVAGVWKHQDEDLLPDYVQEEVRRLKGSMESVLFHGHFLNSRTLEEGFLECIPLANTLESPLGYLEISTDADQPRREKNTFFNAADNEVPVALLVDLRKAVDDYLDRYRMAGPIPVEEKKAIAMMLDGYLDVDIAEEVGVTRQAIGQRRKHLMEFLRRRLRHYVS